MNLLSSCKFNGPILWTEIAHCETKLGKTRPVTPKRVATSICSRLYLAKEIKTVPNDWLIIAVEVNAYEILLPMCPDNTLVGIPIQIIILRKEQKAFILKSKKILRIFQTRFYL